MDTSTGHDQNADQIAYWNGPGGQRWASRQAAQDILLAPVADILIDRAGPKAGERILDVGCGSGATTIAFAGYWAIGLFSNNHFDGSLEASMTAAFVFGPAGAVIGLVVGAILGKSKPAATQMPTK